MLDRFSFPPLLKAAANFSGFERRKNYPRVGFRTWVRFGPYIQTALIRMYDYCGQIRDAQLVFEKICLRVIVIWTIIVDG